jgi:hypothetical protein
MCGFGMFDRNLRKYLKNIDFLRFSWLLKEKNNLSAEAYSH